MRLWARQLALGLLLTAAIPATAVQAADNAEQTLLNRAIYWRTNRRPDLARASLDKLLALNPGQADALYQYGILEVQQGHPTEARRYLLRLQQVAPKDPRIVGLRAAVRGGNAADERRDAGQGAISGSSTPPAGAAQAAESASAGSSAPVALDPGAGLPAPLESTARSVDSDDLIGNSAAPVATAAGAVAAKGAGGSAAATKVPVTVSGGQSTTQLAQLELAIPGPVGGYQPPITGGQVPAQDSLQLDIERSMAQIEAETSPMLEAGAIYRFREGQSGLSALNEVGVPIVGRYSPGLLGNLELAVSPVWLSAGSVSTGSLPQFGANELLAAHNLSGVSPGDQSAVGVLTSLGYSFGPFSGRIGDSAWGFPVNNIIGDIAYQPKFLNNTMSVRIEGERTPVTDSLLSYAGTSASLGAANALTHGAFGTNGTWGGVVNTGIRASVFYDDNYIGAFGGFGASYLTGTNVAQNDELQGFMGAYFRPYRTENSALRVGVNLIYFGFDKNLSFYSFGQGGYFSPQNYEAITFPVEYQGRTGRWSYLGSVALGVQHFNQEDSPFFPNNPYAQIALEGLVGDSAAFYPGSTTTGIAADLRAQVEYAISDNLSVGAAGSFDNGHSYNEGIVKVYLRKTFSDPPPVMTILPGTPMKGPN